MFAWPFETKYSVIFYSPFKVLDIITFHLEGGRDIGDRTRVESVSKTLRLSVTRPFLVLLLTWRCFKETELVGAMSV